MSLNRIVATCLVLVSVPSLYAADAAPAIRKALQSDAVVAPHFWADRAAFDARPQQRGAFAYFGGTFASLSGREAEIGEGRVGVNVTDNVSLWYARQSFRLKGRHAGNEFNVQSDLYGVKWVAMPGKSPLDPSLAFEVQTNRPDSATARTNSSKITFVHTNNFGLAAMYGPWKGYQARVAYDNVDAGGSATGEAHVVNLAVARDWELGNKLNLRGQVHLVNQSYSDITESKSFDLKPYFYAALSYDATSFLRLEADGTLFTNGLPLAGTNYTATSSYLIYRPGGVAESLRNDTIGFASLRIVFHKSF